MGHERVGVVGGGMSAVSAARRVRPDVEIVVLEATGWAAYGLCGLPYYLAGVVDPRRCSPTRPGSSASSAASTCACTPGSPPSTPSGACSPTGPTGGCTAWGAQNRFGACELAIRTVCGAVVSRLRCRLGGPLRAVEARLPDCVPLHPAARAAGPRRCC
jgi:hypothetical protein